MVFMSVGTQKSNRMNLTATYIPVCNLYICNIYIINRNRTLHTVGKTNTMLNLQLVLNTLERLPTAL